MYYLKMALVFGIITLSLSAYAQDFHPKYDYVITVKNDTLKCKITASIFQKDYGNGYKYKLEKDTANKTLKTDSIKEFYRSKYATTFVAVMLPGQKEKRFVSLLERGKINLYEDVAIISNNYITTYYANKNGSPLFEIKTDGVFRPSGVSSAERRKALADMLSDNPALLQSFNKEGGYDFDTIRNFINLYNFDAKN